MSLMISLLCIGLVIIQHKTLSIFSASLAAQARQEGSF